ncbi:hypothetical protein BD410DRAFT_886653 [Rickenella mellea]|uniref:Homeobox domain-containing protein n=1 Tax=Rickenella mellea TaxID=50990 RepID=A0A4Y7QF22_9AGAM|nr:hypothetical protein BD410DRAFT_886653 [Rickenella mellea]
MQTAKDLHFDELATFRTLANVETLRLDSTAFSTSDTSAALSSSASSHTTSTASPGSPEDDAVSNATEPAPGSPDLENIKEPASGPQRSRALSSATAKSGDGKEKRKRSRVTPEQLAHLERFFAADRSPTAIRRREISDILGMQERQTQIWFQNRRAKAKLLDGKKNRNSAGDWSETTPPDTPPQLSPGFEADLHSLIHEDEPVTIIPCSDLSIGTWRRIAANSSKHDLVAYVCDAKRSLTWFIHNAGYGFKMEIPYDTITHSDFRNASPGQGLASFTLSQPPTFYLEHLASPREGLAVQKAWKKCADWTEGMQATKVLRHDLIGSAVHLAHFLQDLRDNRSSSDIQLITPPLYNTGEQTSSSVLLPQPPFMSLRSNTFVAPPPRPDYMGHGRKRSFSGPPAFIATPSSFVSDEFPLAGIRDAHREAPASAGYSTSTFAQASERFAPIHYSHNYNQRPAGLSSSVIQSSLRQPPAPTDFSNVRISHSMAHRPLTTNPSSQFMFEPGRDSPAFEVEGIHRSSSTPTSHTHFQTPSPPLLTNSQVESIMGGAPGYRAMHSMQHQSSHPSGSPGLLPSLTPLTYSSHEGHQGQDVGPNQSNSLVGALGMSTSSQIPDSHMQVPSPAD